ncbi:MAG: DMT family transporter, partial [Mailhella sp.]|nr:DMT family transporter [Mailhella sp.]
MKQRSRLVYYLALSVAVVIWGSSFPALKIALSQFSPVQVLAGRMLTSALICLPVMRSLWPILRDDRKTLRILLFAVLCEPCIYFLFEGYALRFTTASQAGLV